MRASIPDLVCHLKTIISNEMSHHSKQLDDSELGNFLVNHCKWLWLNMVVLFLWKYGIALLIIFMVVQHLSGFRISRGRENFVCSSCMVTSFSCSVTLREAHYCPRSVILELLDIYYELGCLQCYTVKLIKLIPISCKEVDYPVAVAVHMWLRISVISINVSWLIPESVRIIFGLRRERSCDGSDSCETLHHLGLGQTCYHICVLLSL